MGKGSSDDADHQTRTETVADLGVGILETGFWLGSLLDSTVGLAANLGSGLIGLSLGGFIFGVIGAVIIVPGSVYCHRALNLNAQPKNEGGSKKSDSASVDNTKKELTNKQKGAAVSEFFVHAGETAAPVVLLGEFITTSIPWTVGILALATLMGVIVSIPNYRTCVKAMLKGNEEEAPPPIMHPEANPPPQPQPLQADTLTKLGATGELISALIGGGFFLGSTFDLIAEGTGNPLSKQLAGLSIPALIFGVMAAAVLAAGSAYTKYVINTNHQHEDEKNIRDPNPAQSSCGFFFKQTFPAASNGTAHVLEVAGAVLFIGELISGSSTAMMITMAVGLIVGCVASRATYRTAQDNLEKYHACAAA